MTFVLPAAAVLATIAGPAWAATVSITVQLTRYKSDKADGIGGPEIVARLAIGRTQAEVGLPTCGGFGGCIGPDPSDPWRALDHRITVRVPLDRQVLPVDLSIHEEDCVPFLGCDEDTIDIAPGDSSAVRRSLDCDELVNRTGGPLGEECSEANPRNGLCWRIVSLADADADGLLDAWELHGYDHDGDGGVDVNLPAWGATPDHKDLFFELEHSCQAVWKSPPSRRRFSIR